MTLHYIAFDQQFVSDVLWAYFAVTTEATMGERYFGPVRIENGMFSSEKTVSFEHNGKTLSLLVDSSDVRDNRVRVRMISQNNNRAVIDLPREPFSGSARLSVEMSTLDE